VSQPDEIGQKRKESGEVFATLTETDTVVTSFVLETKDELHPGPQKIEFAIALDGDQEDWYFMYRTYTQEPSGAWQVAWRGSYDSCVKRYVSMAIDMVIEASPYAAPPSNEDAAVKEVDKIRNTEI
jgi:hypothetical protein